MTFAITDATTIEAIRQAQRSSRPRSRRRLPPPLRGGETRASFGQRIVAILVLLLLFVSAAIAVQPDEVLDDPVLEERARDISAGLRCLVCQNQSIDDSNAPLARDLRILVRERLEAGDSNAEVKDYLVARYGDFILLRPRFAGYTLILWLTPLAVLVVGGVVAAKRFRRPRPAGEGLSPEEEEKLARVLRD